MPEQKPRGGLKAHRIEQALANLLSNAAKFSPKGGEVTVSIVRDGDRVRVAVSDKGPGIPVEMQQKIFEKFVQADSSVDVARKGTGLGLSVTKAIVEAHGSSIHLVSEPGQGTTFCFDLNVVAAPAERFKVPA